MIFDGAVTDDFVLFTVIYVQGEEGREGEVSLMSGQVLPKWHVQATL